MYEEGDNNIDDGEGISSGIIIINSDMMNISNEDGNDI